MVQHLAARELGQMTVIMTKACTSALFLHLIELIELNIPRIGLRMNLASDFVSEIGIMIIFDYSLVSANSFSLSVKCLIPRGFNFQNGFI